MTTPPRVAKWMIALAVAAHGGATHAAPAATRPAATRPAATRPAASPTATRPASSPAAVPADPFAEAIDRRLREAAGRRADGDEAEAAAAVKAIVGELEAELAKRPNAGQLHYLLGEALDDLGEAERAAASLRKACDLDARNAKARLSLGGILLRDGKDVEAVELYRRAVAIDPRYLLAHYNLGQVLQNQGKFQASYDAFAAAAKLQPADVRILAKLVQNAQALGKTKDRDVHRTAILALFKAGKVEDDMYCREQFVQDKQRVMVFEHFELKGERAVRYAFNVLDDAGRDVRCRISLGSYDMTTEIARSVGDIGKDERMFHLDAYFPGGEHQTLGMFKKEPAYEETRGLVIAAMTGKLKPQSSSKPGANGVEVEIPEK